MFEALGNKSELTVEEIKCTRNYENIYQYVQTPCDLITFLNWKATDETTRQLEILLRKFIEQASINSIVYNTSA